MNKPWIVSILIISFVLLSLLKLETARSLKPFFKADRVIKLDRFAKAKISLTPREIDLLELWESMLTGRVAPLSKSIKDQYKTLGLNHLFTPSGFHLSAILTPITKFIRNHITHLFILGVIGLLLSFLPGQSALKRMVLVKFSQKNFGLKVGFIVALLIDVLWGSFQSGALSFTYSFLFLGIIYSGAQGLGLVLWFFTAQMILALFQGLHISPLLIILSPLINLAFGLAMPVLFLLAFPLWDWQLKMGLTILEILQTGIEYSLPALKLIPMWEVSIVTLALVLIFFLKKWKLLVVGIFIFSGTLNPDFQKEPSLGSHDFIPIGELKKVVTGEEEDKIYFSDGWCKRKLVRGLWWEKCSPRRRSNRS